MLFCSSRASTSLNLPQVSASSSFISFLLVFQSSSSSISLFLYVLKEGPEVLITSPVSGSTVLLSDGCRFPLIVSGAVEGCDSWACSSGMRGLLGLEGWCRAVRTWESADIPAAVLMARDISVSVAMTCSAWHSVSVKFMLLHFIIVSCTSSWNLCKFASSVPIHPGRLVADILKKLILISRFAMIELVCSLDGVLGSRVGSNWNILF